PIAEGQDHPPEEPDEVADGAEHGASPGTENGRRRPGRPGIGPGGGSPAAAFGSPAAAALRSCVTSTLSASISRRAIPDDRKTGSPVARFESLQEVSEGGLERVSGWCGGLASRGRQASRDRPASPHPPGAAYGGPALPAGAARHPHPKPALAPRGAAPTA